MFRSNYHLRPFHLIALVTLFGSLLVCRVTSYGFEALYPYGRPYFNRGYDPNGHYTLFDPLASGILRRQSPQSGRQGFPIDLPDQVLTKRIPRGGLPLSPYDDTGGTERLQNDDASKRFLYGIGTHLLSMKSQAEELDLSSLHEPITSDTLPPDNSKIVEISPLKDVSESKDEEIDKNQIYTKFNDSFQQLVANVNENVPNEKRFLESLSTHIIKKDNDDTKDIFPGDHIEKNKRYLDGIASSLIKKSSDPSVGSISDGLEDNEQLNHIERTSIDKQAVVHDQTSEVNQLKSRMFHEYPQTTNEDMKNDFLKHNTDFGHFDSFGRNGLHLEEDLSKLQSEEIISEAEGMDKRYLDGIASSLIKKQSNGATKRYLDGIASSLIKRKHTGTEGSQQVDVSDTFQKKRYLDGIASSLIKKDKTDNENWYLGGIGTLLIKKEMQGSEKRYLDGIASSLIKKESPNKEKRYLDGIASSLIKKESPGQDKRYLDGIASSLIKKESTQEKRYLDGVASSLIKKESSETNKRYLDGIASSLIKKKSSENDKRYLDGIASSLIKKKHPENEKRYLDGIASSLIKKESSGNEKRYLDGIASSLIKKENPGHEKRYLDGIASSLIKKESSSDKRYLDGIASSLIKKDSLNQDKRYLDGIASSLIKKNVQDKTKRYLDGIASSLIKKDVQNQPNHQEKRYLDGIASSLIKKDDGQNKKRYLDGIASSLIKKNDGLTEKRYLDGIASSLIKKDDGQTEKRYLDGIASSLIKKDDGQTDKRYLDGIASSLIKKDDGQTEKRYLDGIASSLIKKDDGQNEKRYLDGIASSLIKKDDGQNEKRYLDGIASSLIKKDDVQNEKRYLDGIASSLIKRDKSEGQIESEKRTSEVTDEVMTRSNEADKSTDLEQGNEGKEDEGNKLKEGLSAASKQNRRRRDVSLLNRHLAKMARSSKHSLQRQKRYIDSLASTLLIKRQGHSDKQEEMDNSLDSLSAMNVKDNDFSFNSEFGDSEINPTLVSFSSSSENNGIPGDNIQQSESPGTLWTFNQMQTMPHSSHNGRERLRPYFSRPLVTDSEGFTQQPYQVFSYGTGNAEMASKLFESLNRQRVNRALNNLLHQRYLDLIASTLVKRFSFDDDDEDEYPTGFSVNSDPYTSPSKRFTTRPRSENSMDQQLASIKRYIDSIASTLLYKKRPSSMEMMSDDPSAYSSRMYLPGRGRYMRSRLRAFHSNSEPQGVKLRQASTTWRGRPTLMTAMMATGKGPSDDETKAYLRSAVKDYVIGVTEDVFSNAKILDESVESRLNQQKQQRETTQRRKQHRNSAMPREHLDSLADTILSY